MKLAGHALTAGPSSHHNRHFLCLVPSFTSYFLLSVWLYSRSNSLSRNQRVSCSFSWPAIMAKTLSDHLLNTLEELVPYDFEKFKFKLQNTSLEKEHSRIPRGHLQMARPVKLATLLINYYGEEYAVRLTLHTLRAINQRLLAEELHKATGSEVDEQGQNSDGSANLPPSQPEVGKGPQKKSPCRRRDQKGPEGPDAQSKLWARGSAPLSRSPMQSPGAKERKASAQLRRNASSAGRLQGLGSGSLSLGPKEGRRRRAWVSCREGT